MTDMITGSTELAPWALGLAIAALVAALVLGSRHIAGRYGAAPTTIELTGLGLFISATSFLATDLNSFSASLGLGWFLATLVVIDVRIRRLPDPLTLPLLLCGLAATQWLQPHRLVDHAIGAAVGYGALAILAAAYRRIRQRAGLGLGDAKLLAAGGAWLGWQALPTVLLLASLAGLAMVFVATRRTRDMSMATALAFGPALALGIWVVWIGSMLLGESVK